MRPLLLSLALALLAAPVIPQEPDVPPPSVEGSEGGGVSLVASGWCTLADSSDEDAPGCDLGVGVALERWGKVAAVAVVGTETAGLGLAWIAGKTREGRTIAVSVGLIARFDEGGVYTDSVAPAVGCTLSFGGRR